MWLVLGVAFLIVIERLSRIERASTAVLVAREIEKREKFIKEMNMLYGRQSCGII